MKNKVKEGAVMRCPECFEEFEIQIDIKKGNHFEHKCSNGHFMQWDRPPIQQGKVMFGPPIPCEHTDKKISGALVPLP